MIVFDEGLAGGGVAIAPVPSGADAGVVEIGDVAVSDRAVLGVGEDDAAGAGVEAAAVVDDGVDDDDVVIDALIGGACGFADVNSAAAEVVAALRSAVKSAMV